MGQLAVGLAGAAIGFVVTGFNPIGASIGWALATAAYSLLNPVKTQGPRLNELHVQGSTYGRAIPIVYGRMRIAGNGCFQTDWDEHAQESGGKGGGSENTSYSYTNSFGFAICEGPIVGVIRRWGNGKLLTDTGYEADSKWPFVLYLGDETQMPDPTIEAEHGVGEVSPMRGIAYEVVTDKDGSDSNNSVPNVEYEVYTHTDSSVPARVSSWEPPLDSTSVSWTGSAVCGATLSGSTITYGFWEDLGGDFQYTQYTYDLQGVLQTTDGPTAVPQIPDNGFGNAAQKMLPASNAQVAFGALSSQGTNNVAAAAWYVGANYIGLVSNISGSPRSHDACLPSMQPFVYNENIYCIGSTSSTSLGSHIARYPCPTVDGLPEPDGMSDANYVFATDPGRYAVTADDEGNIWVRGPSGADSTLTKLDADLNLIFEWAPADMPAAWPTAAENFAVHQGRLFFATGATAYCYSIDGTTAFTAIGDCDVDNTGSPRLGRPIIWLGGCYALSEDGVLSICGGAAAVPLGDIVEDLCVRAGMDASQVDVTDLTQEVIGFVVAAQMDVSAAIDTLRRGYFFDAAEVDGKIVFVNRGHDPVAEIDDDDLCAREFDADPPAPLQTTRTPEQELPKRVWVNYYNADQDYQTNTQYATRQVTTSQNEVTLDLPLVLTDAEALLIAHRHLLLAWVEREQFSFTTSRKYSELVPTDVVTVRNRNIRITSKTETPSGVIRFEGVAAYVGELTVQSGSTGATGGGFHPQPTPEASVATQLVPLDIPLIGPSDHQFGFYCAAGPVGTGPWPGCVIYKSLDDGVSWTRIGSTRTPSVIGSVVPDGTYPDVLASYALGDVVDETTIRVVLKDDDAELISCTADALTNGANLCAIARGVHGSPSTLKWEICHFRDAVLVSPKVYTLTGFVRGRKDSETADHASADLFVLLGPVVNIEAPESELNVSLKYKAVTIGLPIAGASEQDFINTGLGRDDFFDVVAGNIPSSIVHHIGTTYTFLETDRGKLHTFANASTVTVTLPAALREGWWVDIENIGVGDVVLDPAGNLDGSSSSLTLETDTGITLRTDGTDYWTMRGMGTGGGGGGSGIEVEDEGVSIGTGFTKLNIVGAPVTALDSGGGRAAIVVTGQVVTKDDGVLVLAASPTLDFTTGIAATNAGGGVTAIALADMVQSTIKGRAAGSGTGVPIDLTATQATAILNDMVGDSGSGGTKGLVPAPTSGDAAAGKYLKASGTWVTPEPSDGDKGDVVVSSGGTVWSIDSDAVTNAMLKQMVQSRIKGRAAGAGTGAPQDLTPTQATAILDAMVGDSGSGGTKGLVPAPAAGDTASDKFLNAAGAWANPTTFLGYVFGMYADGADGAVVMDGTNTFAFASKSGNIYTLTADVYATTMQVDAAVTLRPNGFRIFANVSLTHNGLIENDGNDAVTFTRGNLKSNSSAYLQNGSGAIGGTAGISAVGGVGGSLASTSFGFGGGGGAGGAGGGNAGGNAGTVAAAPGTESGIKILSNPLTVLLGGRWLSGSNNLMHYSGGAGGGGGGGSANSGAGGSGAWAVVIFARTILGSGTLRCRGGVGGNATTGNSGGGGGGGGGFITVVTSTSNWASLLTTNVLGGVKGTKVGTGVDGSDGSPGLVKSVITL